MAWLAKRTLKKIIVILTSGVIQFDQNSRATAEETAVLFFPSGQSPRGPNWSFIDQNDDSGKA